MIWQNLLRSTLDLIFPLLCLRCRCAGYALCPSCLSAIQPFIPPFCSVCGLHVAPGDFCSSCAFHPLAFSGLRAAGRYQEPLRTYIHALKYRGQVRLAEPLGLLLARVYHAHALQADLVVPVPLHPQRERLRGYNQAELLARSCATYLSLTTHTLTLVRHKATPAQVGLSFEARAANMHDAFSFYSPLVPALIARKNVLLIDDVYTTGATLKACAALLFAAGARSVWGLVLARTS